MASKKGFRKRTELFANFRCGAEHGPKGRPGILSLHRRLETLEQSLFGLHEERDEKPLPAFEVAIQGTDADAGQLRDLAHLGLKASACEHLTGSRKDARAVRYGV